MIAAEGRLRHKVVHQRKPVSRAECHGDRDGAIQLYDRRMGKTGQLIVKPHNPRPIGRLRRQSACMAGGDRGLEGV